MKKINSKGFGFVGVLAVIIVLAAAGGAGAYVYHKNHKAKATTGSSSTQGNNSSTSKSGGTTQKVDPYAGWKTYSNDQVSFKYPSDWTATMGRGSSAVADATSPAFSSSTVTTLANPGAPINLYLQLSTDQSTVDCGNAPCQVVAITPLHNAQLSGDVLALVDQTSNNGTRFTEYVVAGGDTKVGDTSIAAAKVGGEGMYVFGQPYYTPNNGELTLAARVADPANFQTDSHFRDLVTLVNTIKFN